MCEGHHDNKEFDLIVRVRDELKNERKGRSYVVKEMMGKGAFGQVFLVEEKQTSVEYAAKIIKSAETYNEYTMEVEYKALVHVNKYERALRKSQEEMGTSKEKYSSRIVKLRDQFEHLGHIVLVFEKLDLSLYDLLKVVNFEGVTLNMIREFGRYILEGIVVLHSKNITHCDLKPENIMLIDRELYRLKIIDLGSSCLNNNYITTYMQSRYYRAPEVVLQLKSISQAIDVWSAGCIFAELYLGIPIFPGILSSCRQQRVRHDQQDDEPARVRSLRLTQTCAKRHDHRVSSLGSLLQDGPGERVPTAHQH